ncbi:hypothetical protein M404DRAFT_1001112 [Pisolithus tinctorius Marx 270]|uniref:Uncharacterized protein n=1 Tax=Pisolithus tinctorius Marx 270 TaxID=870435 RepID=A0A0C3P820_PISTI|nr:hypothetical protein M404DRAFT_1006994 [Pisolithus tinctorius Marx 270]KIO03619.1 hypothetical protein M404DRAFT_1001112 [Pisolithus tinctorius Marx 270]
MLADGPASREMETVSCLTLHPNSNSVACIHHRTESDTNLHHPTGQNWLELQNVIRTTRPLRGMSVK